MVVDVDKLYVLLVQESHPGVKEHKPQILNAPSRILICALDIHQEQSQHIYNSQHSCQK